MIFKFIFLTDEKLKNKTGEFDVADLTISDEDIDYKKVTLIIDGKEYDGKLETFMKKLDDKDIFRIILNDYLRDSSDYKFLDGWNIFDDVKSWKCTENGIVITLPLFECDELALYDLILYTPDNMFYRSNDNFLLLDDEGNIKTDYEHLWFDGLMDTLANIRLGKEKLLYKSSDFEEFEEAEYEDLIEEIMADKRD